MTRFHLSQALLPDGWRREVALSVDARGIITAVEPDAPAGGERLGITVPGVTNLHSHAFQRGMAGIAERAGPEEAGGSVEPPDSFWSWRSTMYAFTGHLTPEDVAAAAALAQCEMLESGFTGVVEFHYLHHDPEGREYEDPAVMAAALVDAAERTGIGLALLPVLYRHGGFDDTPPAPAQRRFVTDLDRFARLVEASRTHMARLSTGVTGIAPHSLRAVRTDEVLEALSLAAGGPVHMHVAEQPGEVEACLASHGTRPVTLALDALPVDDRWCLIHCTHVTGEEVRRLARSGATVGVCPVTEANLGDGVFPGPDFMAEDGHFGVGTDSNVHIDLAGELRILEYGQRLLRQARTVLAGPGEHTGARLFRESAAGGARASGRATGRLAVGAQADLVELDGEHPSLAALNGDALLDAWVFAGDSRMVRRVWVGGRPVVDEGRAHARDQAEAEFLRRLVPLRQRLTR